MFLFFLIPHSGKDQELKKLLAFKGLKISHPYLVNTSFIISLEEKYRAETHFML